MVLSVLNIKKGILLNCVFFFFLSLPFPFPFPLYLSYFSHAIYIVFPIRPMLSFPDEVIENPSLLCLWTGYFGAASVGCSPFC